VVKVGNVNVPVSDLHELRTSVEEAVKLHARNNAKGYNRFTINSTAENGGYRRNTVPNEMINYNYFTNNNFTPSLNLNNSNNNNAYWIPHPTRNGKYMTRQKIVGNNDPGSYTNFYRSTVIPTFLEEVFRFDTQSNWMVKRVTQEKTRKNTHRGVRDDTFKVVICHRWRFTTPPCIFYIRHLVDREYFNDDTETRKKSTFIGDYRHYFYVSAIALPLIPEKYVLIVPSGPLEKRELNKFRFSSIRLGYQIHYKTRIGPTNDALRHRLNVVLTALGLARHQPITYVRRIHDTFDAEENVNVDFLRVSVSSLKYSLSTR
jgi:hypothetical protein